MRQECHLSIGASIRLIVGHKMHTSSIYNKTANLLDSFSLVILCRAKKKKIFSIAPRLFPISFARVYAFHFPSILFFFIIIILQKKKQRRGALAIFLSFSLALYFSGFLNAIPLRYVKPDLDAKSFLRFAENFTSTLRFTLAYVCVCVCVCSLSAFFF